MRFKKENNLQKYKLAQMQTIDDCRAMHIAEWGDHSNYLYVYRNDFVIFHDPLSLSTEVSVKSTEKICVCTETFGNFTVILYTFHKTFVI